MPVFEVKVLGETKDIRITDLNDTDDNGKPIELPIETIADGKSHSFEVVSSTGNTSEGHVIFEARLSHKGSKYKTIEKYEYPRHATIYEVSDDDLK